MMNNYVVEGYGHYDDQHGMWDLGINKLSSAFTENVYEFIPNDFFMGLYVNEKLVNEKDGNRFIRLVVRAKDHIDAEVYARVYCDNEYPKVSLKKVN